jgi:hypothetical protein
VTGYAGTVTLSSDDRDALVSQDYTFTASDNGTHVFYAIFQNRGRHYLRTMDTALTSLMGEQDDIDVFIS